MAQETEHQFEVGDKVIIKGHFLFESKIDRNPTFNLICFTGANESSDGIQGGLGINLNSYKDNKDTIDGLLGKLYEFCGTFTIVKRYTKPNVGIYGYDLRPLHKIFMLTTALKIGKKFKCFEHLGGNNNLKKYPNGVKS